MQLFKYISEICNVKFAFIMFRYTKYAKINPKSHLRTLFYTISKKTFAKNLFFSK